MKWEGNLIYLDIMIDEETPHVVALRDGEVVKEVRCLYRFHALILTENGSKYILRNPDDISQVQLEYYGNTHDNNVTEWDKFWEMSYKGKLTIPPGESVTLGYHKYINKGSEPIAIKYPGNVFSASPVELQEKK